MADFNFVAHNKKGFDIFETSVAIGVPGTSKWEAAF